MAKRTTRRRRSEARPAPPRRAYWEVQIAECGRSGLSQAEFCRRRRLVPGTFAYWKHVLAHDAGPARSAPAPRPRPTSAFVPVRVVATPVPPAALARRPVEMGGELEIVCANQRRVRVRGRIDAPWLGEVLRTVERLGC